MVRMVRMVRSLADRTFQLWFVHLLRAEYLAAAGPKDPCKDLMAIGDDVDASAETARWYPAKVMDVREDALLVPIFAFLKN